MFPIVVCVGGPYGRSKLDFIRYWTRDDNQGSYDTNMCYHTRNGIMLYDTPTVRSRRKPSEYSSETGPFAIATLILDFGDWEPSEVHGGLPRYIPRVVAGRDPEMTMFGILQRHYKDVALAPLPVCGGASGSSPVGDCVPSQPEGSTGPHSE